MFLAARLLWQRTRARQRPAVRNAFRLRRGLGGTSTVGSEVQTTCAVAIIVDPVVEQTIFPHAGREVLAFSSLRRQSFHRLLQWSLFHTGTDRAVDAPCNRDFEIRRAVWERCIVSPELPLFLFRESSRENSSFGQFCSYQCFLRFCTSQSLFFLPQKIIVRS